MLYYQYKIKSNVRIIIVTNQRFCGQFYNLTWAFVCVTKNGLLSQSKALTCISLVLGLWSSTYYITRSASP